MPEISVNLANNPYSIVVEPGVLTRLGEMTRAVAPHTRCLMAVDSNVAATHGQIAKRSLEQAGYHVAVVGVLARESAKTLATTQMLYSAMLEARLERVSPVIAVGGGIVGDIAGFAAATFLRGVPVIQVPTTLLAMVDASIGGKTGVNFPLPAAPEATGDGLGKNLVGAFHQPRMVLTDPLTLRTLDRRDFACGLAECIKHAMIADGSLLDWIEQNAGDVMQLKMEALAELVLHSATIKAKIVANDEREQGRRALLNLGHTFAHAIEAIGDLDVRHGEAVAMGLRAASHIALKSSRMTPDEHGRALAALERCGLPCRLPQAARVDRLMHAMAFDKKASNDRMRLVLPRGIGAAEIVSDIPSTLVREAWVEIGAAT